MRKIIDKRALRLKRAKKARLKIKKLGIEKNTCRLVLHKSSQHIYGQVLSPIGGKVLAQANSLELRTKDGLSKKDTSVEVGKLLAERIKAQSTVGQLACDRSGFRYHGRIAVLVDTLREHGINV